MGSAVWFDPELVGRGWLRATIEIGADGAELTASYLADAPRDLLWGPSPAALAGRHDPGDVGRGTGEYRWALRRTGDQVDVRVRWFDDWPNRRSDESGADVLTAECGLSGLVRAVTSGMNRLLHTLDRTGYEARWGHPFPATALARLHGPPDSPRTGRQR